MEVRNEGKEESSFKKGVAALGDDFAGSGIYSYILLWTHVWNSTGIQEI